MWPDYSVKACDFQAYVQRGNHLVLRSLLATPHRLVRKALPVQYKASSSFTRLAPSGQTKGLSKRSISRLGVRPGIAKPSNKLRRTVASSQAHCLAYCRYVASFCSAFQCCLTALVLVCHPCVRCSFHCSFTYLTGKEARMYIIVMVDPSSWLLYVQVLQQGRSGGTDTSMLPHSLHYGVPCRAHMGLCSQDSPL